MKKRKAVRWRVTTTKVTSKGTRKKWQGENEKGKDCDEERDGEEDY